MQLLERPPRLTREPGPRAPESAEALIKEARRLRRRRWLLATLSIAALLAACASILELLASAPKVHTVVAGRAGTGTLPQGPRGELQIAGPLAVAPDGALYVADDPNGGLQPDDRVLLRLPDRSFRVVAGAGKRGYSGDGGPALRARLSDVTALAVGSNGTLYIADAGRVRTVGRGGVIRTIAGNGRHAATITSGTPALRAALAAPLSIALSRSGELYIATASRAGVPGGQILRLTAAGRLVPMRAVVTAVAGGNLADRAAVGKPLTGFDQIAVDGHGNVDVAGGPGGYGVWQITPAGDARLVTGSPDTQRVGGADPVLERGARGQVYAAIARGIFAVKPHELSPMAGFNRPLSRSVHGRALSPLYFALTSTGVLYADDNGPIGYHLKPNYGGAFRQHLVAISSGHSRLLWQEREPGGER